MFIGRNTNAPVGIGILNDLERKSGIFSYKNKWFWLFSKSGFTDRLIREAKKRGNVRLIRYKEISK